MNYKISFDAWWEVFKNSDHPYIVDMKKTVENSPYHREQNVFVHTCMVVNQYIRLSPKEWSRQDLIGAISAVFHDVGKPACEETLTRHDGTEYRRYKGHEKLSAIMFMDFYCKNEFDIKTLLSVDEFYQAWVIINFHLPYNIGKRTYSNLKTHLELNGTYDQFIRHLRADTLGRIPDDMESAIWSLETFIQEFERVDTLDLKNGEDFDKSAIWSVGVPGSGKSSTQIKCFPDAYVISNDDVTTALFPDLPYNKAWISVARYFGDGKKYTKELTDRLGMKFKEAKRDRNLFMHMIEDRSISNAISENAKEIFLSNTNIGSKVRARNFNKFEDHRKIAYVFVGSLESSLERNNSEHRRALGKNVPEDVVTQMYYSITPPILGEFDSIVIVEY